MPDFHCPMGAQFYEADDCILCGLCTAINKDELVAASKKLRAYLKEHGEKDIPMQKIAISGKGGVGKSTITTLLAEILADEGYGVLVIDTDESNPGLYRMFNFEKQPQPLMKLLSRFAIGEPEPNTEWITKDEISISDIPEEYILRSNGNKFMMVGKIEDPFQGCACTMADVTRSLLEKLVLGANELIIIDMEAGVESFGRGVERGVDTVIAVVEPSYESLSLAGRIKSMADGIGVNKVRAILNKVPSEEALQKMKDQLITRNVKVAGVVHYDPAVSEAGFDGVPPGDSKAREELTVIVRSLIEESKQSEENKSTDEAEEFTSLDK
ncbi:P-loop NTPase [Chloroflexota bacterium]